MSNDVLLATAAASHHPANSVPCVHAGCGLEHPLVGALQLHLSNVTPDNMWEATQADEIRVRR